MQQPQRVSAIALAARPHRVQDDLITNNVITEAIAAETQAKLPFSSGDVHQLANVRGAFQVERVSLEEFDCPQQALVHARKTLA